MLRGLRAILDADSALTLRAGVNRGPAFAGDIGASARRAYAVMGDTVNLAARLAARAEPGEILATGEVLERSRTQFETGAALPRQGQGAGDHGLRSALGDRCGRGGTRPRSCRSSAASGSWRARAALDGRACARARSPSSSASPASANRASSRS